MMFTHVRVGASDIQRAKTFYDAALGALGVNAIMDMGNAVIYGGGNGAFVVGAPLEGEPAPGNGNTVGFAAKDQDAVAQFHAQGLAHGGSCEGAPELKPQAGANSYASYLRDPDGNKICAYCPVPD